jgi:uncharacterized protein YndB with AHSA1/START domain
VASSADRIEKEILLRAPQEKVWRAISDSRQFGEWFGMELDGEFKPGTPISGRIKPTIADPAIAEMQKKYAGAPVEFVVDRIEPMRLFSLKWHPFAIDPSVDYSNEPMTLITFTLEPRDGDTLLRVVESGFDSIPIERRAKAFEANAGGWAMQMGMIQKYLALPQS